eukprot:6209653-Pleurochrysis_carterae.AAC.5
MFLITARFAPWFAAGMYNMSSQAGSHTVDKLVRMCHRHDAERPGLQLWLLATEQLCCNASFCVQKSWLANA